MAAGFVCGTHRVFIYKRGGVVPVGEVTPVEAVKWTRIRDDISTAQATVPTEECCELLGDLRTILHELHMVRDGETVWQGPITRLNYSFGKVTIFAEDILWQAKRTVLVEGYDQTFPNTWSAVARMDWLMREMCYARYGNPWNADLQPHRHAGDPTTSKIVNAYQFYVWEDFDKYAEDNGTDYSVVNRTIHYFDGHLAWKILPVLDESHVSQFPEIVEYGNQLATRAFVTNGQGYAGVAQVAPGQYGVVDLLMTNTNNSQEEAPTPEQIQGWASSAAHNLDGRAPSPVSVLVPANTTLMPDAPWKIADLVPGAWFQVSVTKLCRQLTGWQRIHDVTVEESAPNGETVNFTAIDVPSEMVIQ